MPPLKVAHWTSGLYCVSVLWHSPKPSVIRKRLRSNYYSMAPLLFSTALFISALLLFSVQPLVAKMLLPYLGGSPAVWNTCMVFFQLMLLAGYLYAHILPRKIGIRRHAILHLVLLLAATLLLPIGVSAKAIASLPSASSAPLWLLATLLTTVGLPFFILSTNAPLLQSWFSNTAHRRARDPYFLYAASNLGSLLALLSYPVLLSRILSCDSRVCCGRDVTAWGSH